MEISDSNLMSFVSPLNKSQNINIFQYVSFPFMIFKEKKYLEYSNIGKKFEEEYAIKSNSYFILVAFLYIVLNLMYVPKILLYHNYYPLIFLIVSILSIPIRCLIFLKKINKRIFACIDFGIYIITIFLQTILFPEFFSGNIFYNFSIGMAGIVSLTIFDLVFSTIISFLYFVFACISMIIIMTNNDLNFDAISYYILGIFSMIIIDNIISFKNRRQAITRYLYDLHLKSISDKLIESNKKLIRLTNNIFPKSLLYYAFSGKNDIIERDITVAFIYIKNDENIDKNMEKIDKLVDSLSGDVECLKILNEVCITICGPDVNDHLLKTIKFMFKFLYHATKLIDTEIRIGISSGKMNIIVDKRISNIPDIFGTNVNIGSRIAQSCSPGNINIFCENIMIPKDILSKNNIKFTEIGTNIRGLGNIILLTNIYDQNHCFNRSNTIEHIMSEVNFDSTIGDIQIKKLFKIMPQISERKLYEKSLKNKPLSELDKLYEILTIFLILVYNLVYTILKFYITTERNYENVLYVLLLGYSISMIILIFLIIKRDTADRIYYIYFALNIFLLFIVLFIVNPNEISFPYVSTIGIFYIIFTFQLTIPLMLSYFSLMFFLCIILIIQQFDIISLISILLANIALVVTRIIVHEINVRHIFNTNQKIINKIETLEKNNDKCYELICLVIPKHIRSIFRDQNLFEILFDNDIKDKNIMKATLPGTIIRADVVNFTKRSSEYPITVIRSVLAEIFEVIIRELNIAKFTCFKCIGDERAFVSFHDQYINYVPLCEKIGENIKTNYNIVWPDGEKVGVRFGISFGLLTEMVLRQRKTKYEIFGKAMTLAGIAASGIDKNGNEDKSAWNVIEYNDTSV